jgi:hypothetical protein
MAIYNTRRPMDESMTVSDRSRRFYTGGLARLVGCAEPVHTDTGKRTTAEITVKAARYLLNRCMDTRRNETSLLLWS